MDTVIHSLHIMLHDLLFMVVPYPAWHPYHISETDIRDTIRNTLDREDEYTQLLRRGACVCEYLPVGTCCEPCDAGAGVDGV